MLVSNYILVLTKINVIIFNVTLNWWSITKVSLFLENHKTFSIVYNLIHIYENISTAVTCISLTIENGQVTYNASGLTAEDVEFYYVNTMASFSCNPGYSLSGSDSNICQTFGGGTWNKQMPECFQGDEIITVFCLFDLVIFQKLCHDLLVKSEDCKYCTFVTQ